MQVETKKKQNERCEAQKRNNFGTFFAVIRKKYYLCSSKEHMKHLYIILSLALSLLSVSGIGQEYSTHLSGKNMGSLRIQYAPEVMGREAGMAVTNPERPFLRLSNDMIGEGQVLEVSFDELSHETHQYSYTLLHLNADWTQDDLQPYEYLKGFNTADINDYSHSFNTQQNYTNYRFLFPNEDMQPTISGNYAIVVYEDGRREDVVATACFSVVEPMVSITANLRGNTDIELSGRYQQLDIDVRLQGLKTLSPDEIKLVVEQNGRLDNRVFAPKATYVEADRLRWQNCRALIFEGGQEYQHFDIASLYFMGYNVDHLHFDHTFHHAFLFPSEIRANAPYMTENDANGQFVINYEKSDADDTEADYMFVHFILPAERPWFDGTIYLLGDAWHNRFTPENRMTYDNEHQAYVLSCYLKQGGYEWLYAFVPKGSRTATLERVEGSHWQTTNSYRISVYHRPWGGRYDRLVGLSVQE